MSVQRVLDENHSAIVRAVSADQINVQDGVDFAETLDQFLQLQLVTLAQFVWTTPESEFSRGFYDLCQKFLADITNLSVRCFSDGQTSLERLVRNQVGSRNLHTAFFYFRLYLLQDLHSVFFIRTIFIRNKAENFQNYLIELRNIVLKD